MLLCFSDPNGPDLPHWPQYSASTPDYIEIRNPEEILLRTGIREKFCEVWDEIKGKIAADEEV